MSSKICEYLVEDTVIGQKSVNVLHLKYYTETNVRGHQQQSFSKSTQKTIN